MIEQAKHLRNKFIRNGIGGFVFIALFFWSFSDTNKDMSVKVLLILFFAACTWLYFGLRIRYKLKNKMQRMSEADTEALTTPKGQK